MCKTYIRIDARLVVLQKSDQACNLDSPRFGPRVRRLPAPAANQIDTPYTIFISTMSACNKTEADSYVHTTIATARTAIGADRDGYPGAGTVSIGYRAPFRPAHTAFLMRLTLRDFTRPKLDMPAPK
jgi:hypothetical protein